jgi:hypothetical protein
LFATLWMSTPLSCATTTRPSTTEQVVWPDPEPTKVDYV